jgi:D-tyrosyl-tRNA(Tyr) deacylase
MKAIVQRVKEAKVRVNDEVVGSIGEGFVILIGVGPDDTEADAQFLATKIVNLRVFEDENDKMNLALKAIGGSILSISQFTLFADTRKGNRPSFINAAQPELAQKLYEKFNQYLSELGVKVQTGTFGAHMFIDFSADGPVTITFDTKA